jgi:sugar transferase EpsL
MRSGIRKRRVKRLLELALIVLAAPVLVPLLGILAVLVWGIHGRPVLFKQLRPGLHGAPFTIYKFRTMRVGAEGAAASDAERLTAFGRLLRSTSLDELPELLNVVKGDMSLVGPRPLLMEYLDYYTPELRRRHDVLPGITGWAQINGRNTTTWERRFALDLWYVDHHSLTLDAKILALTAWKVITRDGIVQPGDAEAIGKFKGFPPQEGTKGAGNAAASGETARGGESNDPSLKTLCR